MRHANSSSGCNPPCRILLANLVSIGQVAVTYQPDIEQLLVLLPESVAARVRPASWPTSNTKQDYKGQYLSFNLNLNLPPPCTTGFLPAQQQRIPSFEDYPGPPGRRPVLPSPPRLAVQRARCPQHPVRDRAR